MPDWTKASDIQKPRCGKKKKKKVLLNRIIIIEAIVYLMMN